MNNFSDSTAIVEQNLEILKNFVSSYNTRQLLEKWETTQDLVSNHFTKYVFLNKDGMYEYLSEFYKILTIFWDVNDNIDNFTKYMKPCSDFLENLLSLDSQAFAASKNEILRICYILSGVVQGFTTADSFNQFFDWFYPNNFRIITEIFKHFSHDNAVLKALFKLMAELLDNKTHRLKADQSSISGFLLFKEVAAILLEYFKFVDMFQRGKAKGDKYDDKYQFIEMAVDIFGNIVAGNFVNFSVCEYYNDTAFVDLARMVFTLVTMQDQKEYSSFTRLTQVTHSMLENFMKHHAALMMRHFEPPLIVKTLETTLLGLMTDNESKGSCCNGLRDFCSTLYLARDKLADKISDLLATEASIFKEVLKTLLTTVIYEDHKGIWVFQKPLFPTIVINGKNDYEAVKEEIWQNEWNPDFRNKLKEELDALMKGTDFILNKYNREKFNTNFSRFKNNLVKFK